MTANFFDQVDAKAQASTAEPPAANNYTPPEQDQAWGLGFDQHANVLADINRRELLGQFGRDIWSEISEKVPAAQAPDIYEEIDAKPLRPTTVFESIGMSQTGRSIGDVARNYGGAMQQIGEGVARNTPPIERSEILDTPSRLGTLRNQGVPGSDLRRMGQRAEEWGREMTAAQPKPTVTDYTKIDSAAALGQYVWDSLQQAVVTGGAVMTGGVILGAPGAVLSGWGMGVGSMRSAIEDEREKLFDLANRARGVGLDTAADRYERAAKELTPEKQAQIIYVSGTIIGALDSIVPLAVMREFASSQPMKEMTGRAIVRAVTAATAKGMTQEAITEVTQQVVQVLAVARAKGADSAADYVRDLEDNLTEIIDAGIRGGIGGGAFGTVTGARRVAAGAEQPKPKPEGEGNIFDAADPPPAKINPPADVVQPETAQPAQPVADADIEQIVDTWRYVQEAREQGLDGLESSMDAAVFEQERLGVEQLIEALPPEIVDAMPDFADPLPDWQGWLSQTAEQLTDESQQHLVQQLTERLAEVEQAVEMKRDLDRMGLSNARTEDEVRQILRGAGGAAGQGAGGAPGAQASAATAQLQQYLAQGGSLIGQPDTVARQAGIASPAELSQALRSSISQGALRQTMTGRLAPPRATQPKTADGIKRTIADIARAMAPILPRGTVVKSFADLASLPQNVQGELAQRGDRVVDAASGSEIDAFYNDGTVYLAEYAMRPDGRISHEAVHALKEAGLISPQEIKLLADRARKTGAFTKAAEARYRKAYAKRYPNDLESRIDEEAAAHLIEARVNGEDFGRKINGIIDRLIQYIRRLGNALRGMGFQTSDDVVDALLTGEMAARDPIRAWMRENDISAMAVRGGEGMFAIRSDLDMSPEARRARAKAWRHPEGQTEAGKKYSAMRWFHGANRVDRIADAGKFNPKRATSGPMPFFSDAPELASKYATGKQDTSMPDIEHMSQYFTVSPKDMGSPRERTPYTVEQTWFRLSPEQRSTILSRVKRIGFENIDQADGPFVLHPEGVEAINGEHFDWLMQREERGNPLGALRNYWVDSGNLFGSEEDLVRIYQLAGYPFPISTKTAPWYEAPGVIPVVLQLRNPLVTSDDGAIAKVVAVLDVALKGDRTRKAEGGADAWDKNTRYTPKEWLAQLKEDAASGANSFVWTSIPDKITAELRKLGYDGIVDTGGKKGGDAHNVAIPFSPQQVRSINAAFDPAQSASPNLMFAIRDAETGRDMRRTMDALGYYSKLDEVLGSLNPKDKVTLDTLQKRGVKQSEIEARGLMELFGSRDRRDNGAVNEASAPRQGDRTDSASARDTQLNQSISVSSLIETAGRNRVEVREVEYGPLREKIDKSSKYALPEVLRAVEQSGDTPGDLALTLANDGDAYRALTRRFPELRQDEDWADTVAQSVFGGDSRPTGTAKWQNYSLDPSNPSYRETVLHLPERPIRPSGMAGQSWGDDVTFTDIGSAGDPNFRQHHFSDVPNVIGHMMTSMVRHEGRPVYLIDQIQSDWGQKLRDGGVRDEAKINELARKAEAQRANLTAVRNDAFKFVSTHASAVARQGGDDSNLSVGLAAVKSGAAGGGYDVDGRAIPRVRFSADVISEADRLNTALNTAKNDVSLTEAELRTAEAATPGNPLVNTTDQWVNTTLRRAIRQAAEADAAYIAIPHGDTVLSYNPEGSEGPNGMREFYGRSTKEGIVPKNLRKLIEKIDKTAAKPIEVKQVEAPSKGMTNRGDIKISDGGSDFGFTLFPLTDKVKAEVTQRGQVMFAFAGERARTADLDALARAKLMEMEGTKREDIWTSTGWFRAPDGKWKWEIDDSQAQMLASSADMKEGVSSPLGNIYRHPGLFAAYPSMAQTPFAVTQAYKPGEGALARLPDGRNAVVAGYRPGRVTQSDLGIVDVLPHENQHIAQGIEGFAQGGTAAANAARMNSHEAWRARLPAAIRAELEERGLNVRAFSDDPDVLAIKEDLRQRIEDDSGKPFRWRPTFDGMDEFDMALEVQRSMSSEQLRQQSLNALRQTGADTYNRLAGEVEARAVQKRMDMTAEQRRARPPWLDYDVPEDQQIVRFADGSSGTMFAIRELAERNNAADIASITSVRSALPPRLLAFHSTAKPFDAMAPDAGPDLGLHFGRLDVSATFHGTRYDWNERMYPVVIDTSRIVPVDRKAHFTVQARGIQVVEAIEAGHIPSITPDLDGFAAVKAAVDAVKAMPRGTRTSADMQAVNTTVRDWLLSHGVWGFVYNNTMDGPGVSVMAWRGVESATDSRTMFAIRDDQPVTPGLDMSPEARKQRAAAMGFDTSTVYYKGYYPYESGGPVTANGKVVRVDPYVEKTGLAGFFTTNKELANKFSGVGWFDNNAVAPVYLRFSNPLIIDAEGNFAAAVQFESIAMRDNTMDKLEQYNSAFEKGYDAIIIKNTRDEGDIVKIPTMQQVRSVNAAFDPANSSSPNLMYAIRDDATPDEVKSLQTIVGDLARDLGLVMRQGLSKTTAGKAARRAGLISLYNPETGILRVTSTSDLAAVTGAVAPVLRHRFGRDLDRIVREHHVELATGSDPQGVNLSPQQSALRDVVVTWLQNAAATTFPVGQQQRDLASAAALDAEQALMAQGFDGAALLRLRNEVIEQLPPAVQLLTADPNAFEVARVVAMAYAPDLTPASSAGYDTDATEAGWADFSRLYLMNPEQARISYPRFIKAFETFLAEKDDVLLAKLESTQEAIDTFYRADPTRFVAGIIHDPKKPGYWDNWRSDIDRWGMKGALTMRLSSWYTNTVDSANPMFVAQRELLSEIERQTGRKIDLEAAQSAYKLLRLSPHSHAWATRDMEMGVRDRASNEHAGPSLIDALTVALGSSRKAALDTGPGSIYRTFGSYLVARYAVDEWQRYINGEKERAPTAMPPRASRPEHALAHYKQVVALLDQKHPEFFQAADQIYDYQQNLLKLQLDAGLITQDSYDTLVQDRNYVPFYREFGEDEQLSSRALSAGPSGILKRKRGSDRNVVDPIASIAQKTFETRQLIAMNDVKRQLIRLAEAAGPGGGVIAERVDAKQLQGIGVDVDQVIKSAARDLDVDAADRAMLVDLAHQVLGNDAVATYYTQKTITPGRKPIVFFFEDGNLQAMQLGNGGQGHQLAAQLLDSLSTFGKVHTDAMASLMTVLRAPAQLTRIGVTTHPEFALANIVRDALMAFQYDAQAFPLYTQIKGAVDVARNADYVQRYYANAGMMGGEATAALDKLRMERDVTALVERGYRFKLFDSFENFWSHFTAALKEGTAGAALLAGGIGGMTAGAAVGGFFGGAAGLGAGLAGTKAGLDRLGMGRNVYDKSIGLAVGAISGGALGGPIGAAIGALVGRTVGAKFIVKVGEASETATRARLFDLAYQRGIENGLSEVEAAHEAAFWSHDYTDYSRRGSAMEGFAAIIPFLNANIQGNDVYLRRLLGKGDQGYNPGILYPAYRLGLLDINKLSPKEQQELGQSAWTWAMTIIGLGAISAAVAMLWSDDERVKDIDDRVKAGHWLIPAGDTIIRIPKPFQTVWVSQIVERWITEGSQGNRRWGEHYLEDLWNTWKPPMTPAIAEVGATMLGYDINAGRQIIPDYVKRSNPDRVKQFDAYTSEFGKWAGPKLDISPMIVDHMITKFGATWGRTALNLNVPGTPWYNETKPVKGLEEEFIARRFLWKVGRGSEAGQAMRQIMGAEQPLDLIWGKLALPYSNLKKSADNYRDMIEKAIPDHAGAVDYLKTLTPYERGYALMEGTLRGHNDAKYRMLHPMNRAAKIATEVLKMEKEIVGGELLSGRRGKDLKEVPLSPTEKAAARDALTQLRMMEAHNALVLTGETGWKNRILFKPETVLNELKAAAPNAHKELMARFTKAGVLPFDGIARTWPEVKARLEDDRFMERARLNRLVGAGAQFAGLYEKARATRSAVPQMAPQN